MTGTDDEVALEAIPACFFVEFAFSLGIRLEGFPHRRSPSLPFLLSFQRPAWVVGRSFLLFLLLLALLFFFYPTQLSFDLVLHLTLPVQVSIHPVVSSPLSSC